MQKNTIETSLRAVGLASVFSFVLTACGEPENKLSPEEQALLENPTGFLVDKLEDDGRKVVLSPKYGFYDTALSGLSHKDEDNPENDFDIAAKTILGHNKDGQSWVCSDVIMSGAGMILLPKSFNNNATGRDYKIVFDLDQCVELPEGTIPRFPPGTFSV